MGINSYAFYNSVDWNDLQTSPYNPLDPFGYSNPLLATQNPGNTFARDFILALGIGMLILSFVSMGLHSLDTGAPITMLGSHLSFSTVEARLLYLMGWA